MKAWHNNVTPRDVRELLAWVKGRAMPMQVGPGGIPGLTAEDVAGAVGMLTPGLPTRVLIYLHWRESCDRREFERLILGIIKREALARLIEHGTLKLAHDEALANYEDSTHHTERQHAALHSLADQVRAAKARRFPDQPAMWPRLRDAVLAELAAPNHCPECGGRGECPDDAGVPRLCVSCEGRGLVPVSDRQRARWLHRDESSYRESWVVLYEWLYRVLGAAELQAVQEFRQRLFGRLREREVA